VKGYVRGNAGISTNHTLAIINRGGATADEIIMLKSDIQSTVESRFEILLQPEPVFVGFSEK
jgi:UDP-N-acetylmuramate dehydrogenase